METDIKTLWEYACNGKINALKEYFKSENSIINRRYKRLGASYSLIMGAFRNNQFDTVEYLISIGETITDEERKEINKELKRIELIKKLGEL